MRMNILKSILCFISNQCRVLRHSVVLSLAFGLRISLAAVFWTSCIVLILDDGSPASIEFV